LTVDLKQIKFWRCLGAASVFIIFALIHPIKILAQVAMPTGTPDQLKNQDTDKDGLSDYDELYIYHTDPYNPDTDGDGYTDGYEVANGYDPNKKGNDKLEKEIDIDLATQTLTYYLGPYQVGRFLISSGVKALKTPDGQYAILKKVPVVDYKGLNYDYPNTKWNMMFKQQAAGNLYIHGAYWHHNFGHPMSHGCINVSYENMEPLYNWADIGTKVIISNEYKF
jgi:lipoprotein-anchoring transpeptidase ErfK/SrfK